MNIFFRQNRTLRAQLLHQTGRLRTFAKKVFGFRSILMARFILGNPTELPSFGVNELDLRLIQEIDHDSKYYVEIGANDGVSQSNTLTLELFFGWEGVLIEPASSTFRQLVRNRSRRRNYLVRSACVSFEHKGENVELLYANLMSIVSGLDSDVHDPMQHAKDGEKFLPPGVALNCEMVPAVSMNSVLRAAHTPQLIGLLSLDVEGAELEVLRGIDFDQYRFSSILVESRNVERIAKFLSARGYALRKALSAHDYLFQPLAGSDSPS